MTKSLYLKAAHGELTNRPPIWLMRQAGRYLPEYRALRAKHSFLEMMHTPELACEVTLQPIRRYEMDAAILFSDILITAQALGADLDFIDGTGPVISNPITTASDLKNLNPKDESELYGNIYGTIKLLRAELNTEKTSLIGFAGAPFTVASYMIEGGSSKDFKKTKTLLFNNPTLFHNLLEKLTKTTITYLEGQIQAGAEALQLFDSWTHTLSWKDFHDVSLNYLNKIKTSIKEKHPQIPITFFCKNTATFAPALATISPDVISLDWSADLAQVRRTLGPKIALQGNLDPQILYAPKETIIQRSQAILKKMNQEPGYIFNLGHGMAPDMSPEAVTTLVETIKKHI